MVFDFFAGLIADKLASYEFAFYTAGSMMLFSGAVQFLLLCFKAHETKRVEISAEMVAESEETSKQKQYQENHHKEYLARLYVESTLRKDCKISASVESIQLL